MCFDLFQVKSKSRRKARNDESSEESSSEDGEGGRKRPPAKKGRRYGKKIVEKNSKRCRASPSNLGN